MRPLRAWSAAVAATAALVLAHAALVVAGKNASWTAALSFAAVNGLLWFAAAPLAMLLGRVGGPDHLVTRQIALGVVCAPLFGCIQGAVAVATGLRAPVPPLASAFYYLDLNVAVLALSAFGLDLYATRLGLARQARAYLVLETRLLEVRHDVLTLQLQPHFLFNALNSVAALIREAPAEARTMLRHLRTLFLATTGRSGAAVVSMSEELDVVDAFVSVARVRHADRLSFRREIAPEALTASIPPLALQPLVENAIQFALVSDQDPSTVSLSAHVEGGRLRIRVTNSCTGRERPRPGLGIGLRNTRERLSHLFPGDHALTLSVSAGVAIVELDLPFVPVGTRESGAGVSGTSSTARAAPLDARDARTVAPARWRAAAPAAFQVVGFWLVVWLFWTFQMHFYRIALGIAPTRSPFASSVADLMSAICWMALTPLAVFLGRRVPIHGSRWPLAVAVHVVGALACSAANVGFIAAFYGLGSIPINNVINQSVMNCAVYSLLVLWTHAARIGQWFDERQTATRRLEAELARARWNAMEMQLQPEQIAGQLDRLADLVAIDPAQAEEGVLDMADALRRLLHDAERAPASITAPAASGDAGTRSFSEVSS